MLQKPQTKTDLLPPFQHIGDPGWDIKLRHLLEAYDVPLPTPVTIDMIVQREQSLRQAFPASLRLFLTTFGPVDFDGIRLLSPERIDTLEQLWFKTALSQSEQLQLPHLLQIAEAGSDNVYALDPTTQHCGLCSHDPAGFFDWLPSFDVLIHMAIIDLSWSCYGWPDPSVEALAIAAKQELLNSQYRLESGTVLRQM